MSTGRLRGWSMSRSALRVRLRALETRLGISLVDPAARPVTLTPAGRALLPDVHEAVHAMRRLDSLAALHDPAVDGPLAVGALAAPATPTSPVRGVIGLSANCHGG
ncbi:MAG: LysR family transcriptional regulator [Pseudonocardiaceae bacterium]